MSVPEDTTQSIAAETPAPAQAAPTDIYSIQAMMRPNKLALVCGGRSLTYAGLNARGNRVANALRSLGVQAGDRVAVMVQNSLERFEVGASFRERGAIKVMVDLLIAYQGSD